MQRAIGFQRQFNRTADGTIVDDQRHLAARDQIGMADLGTHLDLIVADLGPGQHLVVVDIVHDDHGRGIRRLGVDPVAFAVGRGGAVARRVGAGHAGLDGLVAIGRQIAARHQDGEAAIGSHLAAVFDVVDGQGDGVARLELAAHGAAHRDLLTRFGGVDDVVGGDVGIQFDGQVHRRLGVDPVAFAVGRGGAVARRVGAGHAGVDGLVAIGRQVAARHQDGEAAIGVHRAGERLAIDGQGDGVPFVELAGHGAADRDLLAGFSGIDHIIRRDVGIQGDTSVRRRSVQQAGVVGGAGRVARRVGDAGHHGQVAIRQIAQVSGGVVVAVGIGDRFDGHAVTLGIGDHQGHGAVGTDIGGAADGRVGHIGTVHVIQAHRDVGGGVHAAIIGGCARVAGRIGHAGGHVIAAVRQRGPHIHAEAAIRIDSGDQGLLVAVGVGHHQGHSAAGSGIRGPGEGRGAVVDVVRRGHSDGGCGEIEELILVILRFGQRSGIIRIGGIKAGGGDGGITGSVDGDEATVAAGTSNAAYVARSGCPARRRRFKCLGRVCPRQNRLLQGGDVVRYITLRQVGLFRLGSVARAQGKGGLPPLEAGPFRSEQYCILGQHITFRKKRLAPVSGNQVDFALQLGNDDILIQYDALAAHGFS
ncbi:hypothetical protein D3C73_744460 [compost metagenome]